MLAAMSGCLFILAALLVAVRATTFTVSWGFDTSNASIQATLGDTVTWTWNQTAAPHTLISGAPGSPNTLFGLSTPISSGNYSFVFNQTGLYPYFCNIHTSMTAAIFIVDGM